MASAFITIAKPLTSSHSPNFPCFTKPSLRRNSLRINPVATKWEPTKIFSVGSQVDAVEAEKKVPFSDINAYEVDLGTGAMHGFCNKKGMIRITSWHHIFCNKKGTIRIASSNITENIVKILLREGFVENVRKHRENNKSFLVLTLGHRRNRKGQYRTILKRISRPGLRIYSNYQRIPRVLGGMGIVILSTSQGIMTDREARLKGIGGEILCYIW